MPRGFISLDQCPTIGSALSRVATRSTASLEYALFPYLAVESSIEPIFHVMEYQQRLDQLRAIRCNEDELIQVCVNSDEAEVDRY
jgi:hypothetical protein